MEHSISDELETEQCIDIFNTTIDKEIKTLKKYAITGSQIGIDGMLICKRETMNNNATIKSIFNNEELKKIEKDNKERGAIFSAKTFLEKILQEENQSRECDRGEINGEETEQNKGWYKEIEIGKINQEEIEQDEITQDENKQEETWQNEINQNEINQEEISSADIEEDKQGRLLCVDRFEENIAVCEDRNTREMFNIEKSELPDDVQEGDILRYNNGAYTIDVEAREEIEARIRNKLKNLFED